MDSATIHLPTVLGIAGLVFLFLALVGRIGGKASVVISERQKKWFARAGASLLCVAIALEVLTCLVSEQDEESEPLKTSATVACPLAQASFQTGDEVKVILTGNVHVRRTPDLTGAVVCYVGTGDVLQIVSSSAVCANGIWWWQVSSPECGEGWIAQHRQIGTTILQHR